MVMTSILTDFGFDLIENITETSESFPLNNHPQIPFIIDSLSRYERHPIALVSHQSNKIHRAFIQTIAQQIRTENLPKSLKNSQLLYVNVSRFLTMPVSEKTILHDFQTRATQFKNNNQRIILVIDSLNFLTKENSNGGDFIQIIKQILTWNEWRLILFIPQKNYLKNYHIDPLFSVVPFISPHPEDQISLLKMHRSLLENFHRVIISDEEIMNAFTMAAHYLPGNCHFDKAWELLDSAAARASLLDRNETGEPKSIVTSHFLMQVISHQTQIPVTHLHNTKFQAHKLVESLRKNIFGQDAAINIMASLLQNACIKLQDNSGPLCTFLLVGPQDVGKTETAYAMAEHLFGHRKALLHVKLHETRCAALNDIKVFSPYNENTETHLLSAIQQMPYAILLIEDIDRIYPETFDLIKGIFEQGYVVDEQNNKYDFSHVIVIATTRKASDEITDATLAHSEGNTKSLDVMQLDLMQLVLNEHVHDPLQHNSAYPSPHELCDQLIPKLTEHFPQKLLQQFNIIPFVPLDYAALEKMIKSKIKTLARRLHKSFSIELTFAPEVVKFLAHEALWRKGHIKSLDKLLEQHLYSTITHEILLHAEDKDRSKRLVIQLNETGHLLRCDFLTSNEAAFYSL